MTAMSKPFADYDLDFYSWTIRNAELIRRGEFALVDAEHVAEEIEDMGKAVRRALESRFEKILLHMLKWQFQPLRRGSSWETSLAVHRRAAAKLLRENSSLKPAISVEIAEAYPTAKLLAGEETGLGPQAFPAECPYTVQQVLGPDFYPEQTHFVRTGRG
jgi:hypothetical protein